MNERDKQLKRAWRSQQREHARRAFPIPELKLAALFGALERDLGARVCDHTRARTEAWLVEHGHDLARTRAWLDTNNGFCDCGVLANVKQHVDDAMTPDPP